MPSTTASGWDHPATPCPSLAVSALRLHAAGRDLLRGLDLAIGPGELWVIVGPNGVGKSTLMTTLAGLRAADGGVVTLDGIALDGIAPAALALRRAYLPQAVHDTFPMPVRDAVLVGRHPHQSGWGGGWGWGARGDDAIVEAALHELDLVPLLRRDVMTLSGGERQRVSLASVLVQQAPLMLLDEPLAHLDLRHQIMVLELLARLAHARRHAIVIILHDLNLARRYATHALLLDEDAGNLQGPAADVLTPAHCSRVMRTPIVSVSDGRHAALIADGLPDGLFTKDIRHD